jgi:putative peptidoglycan lipid II flippase
MRSSLAASLRGVLFLSIPAAFGLILLRQPIITLLYQRGEFNERSTQLVAWALLWFAVGLVSHSLVEVLARAFYALHDTRTPVLVGVAAMSLNALLSFAFTALFAQIGWMPHGGLALANSVATTIEMGGLLVLMRRRLKGLEGRLIVKGALQAFIAGGIISVLLWIWLALTNGSPVWLVVLGGVVIGALVYGILLLVMGVQEVRGLVDAVLGRLKFR